MVSSRPVWLNFMPVIRWVRSTFSPSFYHFGSDWILMNPINSSFSLRLGLSRSPTCFLWVVYLSQWVILSWIYLVWFDWNINGSAAYLLCGLQLAFDNYSSCAPAETASFRWCGVASPVLPTGLLIWEEECGLSFNPSRIPQNPDRPWWTIPCLLRGLWRQLRRCLVMWTLWTLQMCNP